MGIIDLFVCICSNKITVIMIIPCILKAMKILPKLHSILDTMSLYLNYNNANERW